MTSTMVAEIKQYITGHHYKTFYPVKFSFVRKRVLYEGKFTSQFNGFTKVETI
jgi:hypothetical protein